MMYGVAITLIPLLLLVGVLARHGKLNYLTLCGLLAGSMTDPPALAFANGMHPPVGQRTLLRDRLPLVMFLQDHLSPAAGHPALGRCLTPHETGPMGSPSSFCQLMLLEGIIFYSSSASLRFTPKPGFISVCSFDFLTGLWPDKRAHWRLEQYAFDISEKP